MRSLNARLVSGKPVRVIGRARRSIRGATTIHGFHISYESSLERDFLHLLSLDPTVDEVIGQPLTIECPDLAAGLTRRYTPDFLVRHGGTNPGSYLIEIKYRNNLWEEFWREGLKAKFLAARRLCREQSWHFRIRTELELRHDHKIANATFLKRFAALDPNPLVEEPLIAPFATFASLTPQTLLAAAFSTDADRVRVIPYLWRMVATGELQADLALPLTMSTPIRLADGERYQWMDPVTYR